MYTQLYQYWWSYKKSLTKQSKDYTLHTLKMFLNPVLKNIKISKLKDFNTK